MNKVFSEIISYFRLKLSIWRYKRNCGFTLTEMIIVISLMGILIAVASRNNARIVDRSKDAALMVEVRHIRNAVHQYLLESGGTFPPDLRVLQKYLGRPIYDWKGSRGAGQYYYNRETGEVTLCDYGSEERSHTLDSKGVPYGDY